MILTKHFTLEEMIVSEYAARNGIKNTPSEAATQNLTLLCRKVLEPLRMIVQKPIIIMSGYRSKKVNAAIGGSSTSQHMKGQAADFIVIGMTIEEVFKIVAGQFPYDQLIQEFGQWVHVSYKEPMRNEKLLAKRVNGKTKYETIA
ncbi:MAG: D-Ala-D-Ala carboxypeptidase family metallohydrolase [Ignavibacteriales bacterium]|nr:D-Ala-D-Ala carboxypeptidase family metallohydrolase [Ignavibacteriales bacterium]